MKNFKLLTALCLILGVTISFESIDMKRAETILLISNIEALANIEEYDELCFEDGSSKCPIGGYSRLLLINSTHNIIMKK